MLPERAGSGYARLVAACDGGAYPVPEWQELGAAFRAVFRPHPRASGEPGVYVGVPANVPASGPVNAPVDGRQRWFIELLTSGSRVTTGELARHWRVPPAASKLVIAPRA